MPTQMSYRVHIDVVSKLIANFDSLPHELKMDYCIKKKRYSTLQELHKVYRVCQKPDFKVRCPVPEEPTPKADSVRHR